MRFTPSNLFIYHKPDVINMWQGRGVSQITHFSSDENPDAHVHSVQTDTRGYLCARSLSLTHTHRPTLSSNRVICVGMILMPGICEALG